MSRKILIVDDKIRVCATIETAVESIKLGAYDYLQKPINFDRLVKVVENAIRLRELQEENQKFRDRLSDFSTRLITNNTTMLELCRKAKQLGATDLPVLICGESGTGKELLADFVHSCSVQSCNPIVKINCSAFAESLLDNELFGHDRGAYTGADVTFKGLFERADGGTLFLDEIADLPMSLQAKLLRVLQDGAFERVGGSETIRTDVRLIAATNRDLQEAVNNGAFRSDLYYRINTVPIQIPPLRERREDIPLLAQHFVMKHGPRLNKSIESISAAMLRYLQDQDWPGNVRELEHCIERSLIASRGPVLTLDERDRPRPGDGIGAGGNQVGNGGLADLRSIERDHILQVLAATRWVIGGTDGAAAGLDLPPSTLRSKMKKLGIERNAKQPARGIEKAEEGGNGKRHAKGVNLKGV
jgi:DNA-binding NtrC family response regulator